MSTPGQVAYEAYATVLHDTVLLEPWRRLLWLDRMAWDAAAQAVLEAFMASAGPLDTGQDDTP